MAVLRPVAPGGDPAVSLALAQLGEALRARPLGPDPDFRAALRARVVAVATVAPHQAAHQATHQAGAARSRRADLRLRFARVGVAGVAASVAVTGLSVATSRSLPGDPLYGAKRAAESFQLAFAGSDLDRGLLHLELARTRLGEVEDLVGRGDGALTDQLAAASPFTGEGVPQGLSPHTAKLVASTLAAMDHETRVGAQLVTAAYLHQREAAPISKLQSFVADQSAGLTAALPTLPSSNLPQANASLQLLNAVNAQANALLETAPPVVPLPAPRPVVLPTTPHATSSTTVVVVPSKSATSSGGTVAPLTGAPVSPVPSAPPPSPAPSDGPSESGAASPSEHPGSPSGGPSPSPSDASSPSPSASPSTPSPSAAPTSQRGLLPWPFGAVSG